MEKIYNSQSSRIQLNTMNSVKSNAIKKTAKL